MARRWSSLRDRSRAARGNEEFLVHEPEPCRKAESQIVCPISISHSQSAFMRGLRPPDHLLCAGTWPTGPSCSRSGIGLEFGRAAQGYGALRRVRGVAGRHPIGPSCIRLVMGRVGLLLTATLFRDVLPAAHPCPGSRAGKAPAARRMGLAPRSALAPRWPCFGDERSTPPPRAKAPPFTENRPRGHWLRTPDRRRLAQELHEASQRLDPRWANTAPIDLFESISDRADPADGRLALHDGHPLRRSRRPAPGRPVLRRAEEMPARRTALDMRRFIAYPTSTPAGRVYALERLLDQNNALAPRCRRRMSPLARRGAAPTTGEPQAARPKYRLGRGRRTKGGVAAPHRSAVFAPVVVRRSTMPPSMPTSTRSNRLRAARPSPSRGARSLRRVEADGPGPHRACVALWLLTEQAGSSESTSRWRSSARSAGLIKTASGGAGQPASSCTWDAAPCFSTCNALYSFGLLRRAARGRWRMFVSSWSPDLRLVASAWLRQPPCRRAPRARSSG